MSMEVTELRRRAQTHAAESLDEGHAAQVRAWLTAGDEPALRAAFEPALRFGTAGVRAPLGPGDARINRLTVRRLATALCEYLGEQDAAARSAGLCVGFDGRHGSATFARDVAQVAGALGFPVHAFDRPVPTPLLVHVTRTRAAAAGVMITASHNPPGDNGVKVYGRGGRPLLPPHDAQVAARMHGAVPPAPDASATPAAVLGQPELDAYLEALVDSLPAAEAAPLPHITYSAMCGVGAAATRALLARLGASPAHEVRGECEPDPDFPGLVSPNPEHPRALDPAMELARQSSSDLVIAHDPDADRLAVAARGPSGMQRLSGDEVGCLLADYLLQQPRGPHPVALVTTLVSSELLGELARAHGALYRRVPTGVKWVSLEGRALEDAGQATYLFGYEEALGYCLPALGDDKDGLAALALLLRCHQHHAAQERDLLDARDAMWRDHGVHRTAQRTWRFGDPARRTRVIEQLGRTPPTTLGETKGGQVEVDPRAPELRTLRYVGPGLRLRVALRPSGTEPKLKAYLEARMERTDDVASALEHADQQLSRAAEALDRALAPL